jgi:hypothetical protein
MAPGTVIGSSKGATSAPLVNDFATRLARVGPDSFISWGHAGGRYAATVYVTRAAKDTIWKRDGAPPGTELAMTTIIPASHKPGPTFVMQKDAAGAWRYETLETTDAKNDGLALCARCHADAPGDHVFGLPE